MRSWILAAALAIAAAPAFADTLAAPVPEGAVVVVNHGDAEVDVGQRIAVALQSNPSTGGRWVVTQKPDFLADAGQRGGPLNAPLPDGRVMVGAPVWQVFLFSVSGPGAGPLVLELHGPGGQTWQSFAATINAHTAR